MGWSAGTFLKPPLEGGGAGGVVSRNLPEASMEGVVQAGQWPFVGYVVGVAVGAVGAVAAQLKLLPGPRL